MLLAAAAFSSNFFLLLRFTRSVLYHTSVFFSFNFVSTLPRQGHVS